jgi:hypothetical protein
LIRLFVGAAVATFVAPLPFLVLVVVRVLFTHPDILSVDRAFALRLGFSFLRIAELFVFSTLFPVGLVLALIGYALRWRSRHLYGVGGAFIGLGFSLFTFEWRFPNGLQDRISLLAFCGIGAVCGWIYWRIAVEPTLRRGRAIDSA